MQTYHEPSLESEVEVAGTPPPEEPREPSYQSAGSFGGMSQIGRAYIPPTREVKEQKRPPFHNYYNDKIDIPFVFDVPEPIMPKPED